jgi:hypothetical protein
MVVRPKLLIATWLHWPGAARITAELAAAGAHVDVLSSDFHPVRHVTGLGRQFRYDMFSPMRSLARAIDRSAPDHIIAADDIAIRHLQTLRICGGADTAALIERSFGPAASYDVIASRARFADAARAAGADVPESAELASAPDLARWLATFSPPAFLKSDGTFGGSGVRLVRQAGEAATVFDSLARTPSLMDAFDQAARLRLFTKAGEWLHRRHPVISVHKAVAGDPANCCAFAWRGEVVAEVSVVTLQTLRPFGVATVVRAVDNPAMRAAAVAIARALDLTGFFGLDFILEPGHERAWVLELNPRPTPISHLALGPGRDLVAGAIAKIGGAAQPARPVQFSPDAPIALFPHLLDRPKRDPLEQDDLPYEQPGLVRAYRLHRRSVTAIRDFAGRGRVKDGKGRAPPRASTIETPLP